MNGYQGLFFRMFLPPWTGSDGIDRTGFFRMPISVAPDSGENLQAARIRFGYGEFRAWHVAIAPVGRTNFTLVTESVRTGASKKEWRHGPCWISGQSSW